MGRLNGGGGPAAAGAAAAALALLLLAAGAAAQQLTPFQGRNRPPAGGVDVHVSAVVDHLIEVDDAQYRFEVWVVQRRGPARCTTSLRPFDGAPAAKPAPPPLPSPATFCPPLHRAAGGAVHPADLA